MSKTDGAIQLLSAEHQNILKVIDILLAECIRLENAKEALNKNLFERAIDFIKNYADKFHHAKEEDILFKEFCQPDVKIHCNPVDQMLYEHDLGRGFVKGMVEALEKDNREKLIENARSYSNLLREHIFKEDNILFPMADEALSAQVKDSMIQQFKKVEQEKFSPAMIEKYLKFASQSV